MSLFKRALSSIGIGGVKIDTQLFEEACPAGGKLNGQIVITGGKVDQDIEFIDILLMTRFRDDAGTHNFQLEKYPITDHIHVPAQEELTVDFSLHLPPDIPASLGNAKVWLRTIADINNAADPTDEDYFQVLPHPIAAELISVLQENGFVLREAEIEPANPEMNAHYPFVQELEFVPKSGAFRGRVKELEVVCIGYDDHAEFFLEIEKKGWFSRERHVRHAFSFEDIRFKGNFSDQVIRLIEEFV